jgi:hypothetical protein
MQVKRIATPVEAERSEFGSAGFWLADSREVASFTHVGDPTTGYPVPQSSVWVGLPFGRDVIVAACMVEGLRDVGLEGLARMSADQVREWALWALLWIGASGARAELDSPAYASGYTAHTGADPDGAAVLPRFFSLVSARLDEAFGFDQGSGTSAAEPLAGYPTPARGLPVLATV